MRCSFEDSGKIMKTAILSVVLAAVPAVCGYAVPMPPAQTAPEQQQKDPPPVASPKATIPLTQGSAKPGEDGKNETDPVKMAAPSAAESKIAPLAGYDKNYTIGPEDVLGVLVWNNKELSGSVMVRPDGRITVGLVSEIIAVGHTPEQLAEIIADKLKEGGYIRAPQVQVSVLQINSRYFFINGEVNKPGKYSLLVPTHVLEALVNAGGFRDFANKKDIRILRGDQQFKFNYNKVIKGQNKNENILLEPRDIIVVK
jgi:polysaccharide export outer membrane protein